MLSKTNAIVLSKLRYRDNDLIVKCYTSQRGVVSYLLRGVLKSKKGSAKAVYFQPLSQLQLEENFKDNQSLQFITDVKLNMPYQTLHTNLLKSSIAMFLSEVLSSVLNEEEPNEQLYEYLETSLNWLDHEKEFVNFHLLFLLNLTKHLGFYPDVSKMNSPYFDLNTGTFEATSQNSYTISGENLSIMKQFLATNFGTLHKIKLNSKQRQTFLSMLLSYFELHLGNFRKPKSLVIFSQVFN